MSHYPPGRESPMSVAVIPQNGGGAGKELAGLGLVAAGLRAQLHEGQRPVAQ